ncbi:DUF1294 domain-containing protein [Natranaerofaba carboxydovora]|uniref:DUF1294 domain-containing protein n=1 Tax=Natranaerofaba carboxydovora TaxID=2742683 RepID=UPI0030B84F78|nr:hypothetical protein ACONDI_01325 [Natranaerofaba carboxydovora]
MIKINILLIIIILINITGFVLIGLDKKRAVKNKWRIPEKNLLFIAVVGGSPGIFIGMKVFRHKINRKVFKYFIPFLILLHLFVFKKLFEYHAGIF